MPKPRVLMMVQLPPPAHGAAIVNLRVVQSERLRAEFDLDVLPVELARTVGDTNKPSVGKLFRLGANCYRLVLRLITRRPALVLYTIPSRGVSFLGGLLLLGIVKIFGVPHILQMRSRGIAKTAERSLIHHLLCRWAFSRATVVLYSTHVFSDVAPFVKPEQVYYLPDGLEDPLAREITSTPIGSVPHVLFLSHLFESKGPLVLIAALGILKRRNLSFRATLVGEPGDLSPDAVHSRLHEAGLAGQVEYAGPAYGAAKEAYFREADIFAFPTYYPLEVFPGVLLEAMAHGLPIATTREAAIPDIVAEGINGYMVPARDAEGLADRLEKLIQDPELRARMGQASRELFVERFQFRNYEKRLSMIIREVILSAQSEAGEARLSEQH